MGVRLFAAVYPSEAARTDLAATLSRRSLAGRSVRPAQWHLTLAFLDGVPDGRLPEVRAAVAQAAAEVPAFTLRLVGAGAFGSVVWVGAGGDTEPLGRLAEELRGRLAGAGFAIDPRPFRAHLTVARGVHTRRPEVAAGLAALANHDGPPWTVRQVVLVRSTLGPGGARHEPVATAELA
ncbi:MAG: 2-5 ligase [Cryptosporangiaceae bacterium]|nr:2-5 ligase [Cryptosporangiaceae bacterium]